MTVTAPSDFNVYLSHLVGVGMLLNALGLWLLILSRWRLLDAALARRPRLERAFDLAMFVLHPALFGSGSGCLIAVLLLRFCL
jgi:hypothetical protein